MPTRAWASIFDLNNIFEEENMSFKNDQEMFDKMEKMLYTAICCNVMDELGYRNQAMRHDTRPIR